MQYHLGVLRMLLFAMVLAEMNGTKVQTSRSSLFHSSTKTLKGKVDMIKALESRLLNIFGLKERPKPTNVRRNIPEFMMELYRAQNLVQTEESFPKSSSLRKRALELHQHHQGRSIHASTTNTVRSFVAETEYTHEKYDDTKDLHLWFNVTSLLSDELLRAAELRVYRLRRRAGCGVVRGGVGVSPSQPDFRSFAVASNHTHQNPHEKNKLKKLAPKRGSGVYLQVYDVLRPSVKLRRPNGDSQFERGEANDFLQTDPLLRLIDTRFVSTDHDGWESFDVVPAIRRWRNRPSENHGLVLRLAHPNGKTIQLRNGSAKKTRSFDRCYGGIGDLSSPVDRQPLLVTYTDDGRDGSLRSSRTKRNARFERRKKRKHYCQRKNLYVDFQDVGWNDWIVAPPGYHAYYCQGDCPFPLSDHLNSTNHAIVQTLVNSANPNQVPRACCVPTELSPISLLYHDEYDKIVLKNYQDMVVEGCGCR